MKQFSRSPQGFWQTRSAGLFLVIAAILLAYSNSLTGPMIFDDIVGILTNTSLDNALTAWIPESNSGSTVSGRPVLNVTLAFNQWLGGKAVVGYHIGNVLIHICATLALFGWLRRTLLLPSMRRYCREEDTFAISLLAAALWGLHPLQTESVTYIVQRAESLAGLLYLLVVYCFVRAVGVGALLAKPGSNKSDEKVFASKAPTKYNLWLGASVAACFLGMGAKEIVVSAPLIVLLYDRIFVAGSFAEAWRKRKYYYAALAASWIVLAVCVAWSGARGGTVQSFGLSHSWSYLMTQCEAILHYLRLCIFPHPLILDYGYAWDTRLVEVWPQAVALVALFVGTVWAMCKKHPLGFAGAFFFALLAPTSSVVPIITQQMAEHRMYLPLAAVVASAVCILYYKLGRKPVVCIGVIAAVVFGAMTFTRNYDYRSAEAIWRTVVKARPQNGRALQVLGVTLAGQGQYEEAEQLYKRAVELEPWSASPVVLHGLLLYQMGKKDQAVAELGKLLVCDEDMDVDIKYVTYNKYGLMLAEQGMGEQAAAAFRNAVALKPKDADASYYYLGKVLADAGRPVEAEAEYRKAIANAPQGGGIPARVSLGKLLLDRRDFSGAISVMEPVASNATREQDADLHYNLATAYWRSGREDEASREFQEALRLKNSFYEAHLNYGILLAQRGDYGKAVEHYESALTISGRNNPLLLAASGRAMIHLGQTGKAVARLMEAANAAPNDLQIGYFLGDALLKADRNSEAAVQFQKLIGRAPDAGSFHAGLGQAYLSLGRRAEALACCAEALRLQPGNEQAVMLRAQLLNKTPTGG